MVRKMACSFGWDWGPDLQTAGIWKPVRLERWRTARIASVRPLVTIDGAATVAVHVDVERSGLTDAAAIEVTVTLGDLRATGTIAPGSDETVVALVVDD